MHTEDDLLESVLDSQIDDLPIIEENGAEVNLEDSSETEQNFEIPRELLFDENGELRTDSSGNTFDAELHVTTDDGYPKLTAAGKLRKKRTPKGAKSRLGSSPSAAQVASKAAVSDGEKYRVMGATCASGVITLGMLLGGEDFQPVLNQYIDEKKNMELAFTEWCKTKQIDDLPPNLALTMVLGGYILPRMTKPKQISKLKLAAMWFKAKFTKKPKIAEQIFDPNKEA